MRVFTYKDYLYYKNFFKVNKNDCLLNDSDEEYEYENEKGNYEKRKKEHNVHDKIFKEVLNNQEEAIDFLNQVLKIEGTKYALKFGELEKYKTEFIRYDFSELRSDIVYKKVNSNIFFIIEHQSTIDYAMAYRILKYQVEIMDSAVRHKELRNKEYKLPLVFAFVIYTGNKKWNAAEYIEQKQEKMPGVNAKPLSYFQVVDVNDYKREELLKQNNFLSKLMLLEKCKNSKDFFYVAEEMENMNMTDEQKTLFFRILEYVIENKISEINETELKEYVIKYRYRMNSNLNKVLKRGDGLMIEKIIGDLIDEGLYWYKKGSKLHKEAEEILKKNAEMEKKNAEMEKKNAEMEKKNAEMEKKNAEIEKKNSKIKKENEQMQKELFQKENKLKNDRQQMIINLIKGGINENKIIEITQIDKYELEEIKKQVI